jgi:tetratricopeptide (TPR) repeat protein
MTVARLIPAFALAAVVSIAGCGETENGATEMKSELKRADEMFNAGDYAKAGELFERIATSADETGDTEAFVEASAMRARSHLAVGDADKGRPWLSRAKGMASRSVPSGWSRYMAVKGRFEWKDGDNESASRTFRELFDYCEEHELWERAVDAANMVSITGDESLKLDWSLRGIEMAERGDMTGWLGPLWNNLGWNYHDAGRYEEALDALVKARDYHYMKEAELPRLIADYSVAHVKMKQGRLEEAQSEMLSVLEWATRLSAEGNEGAVEWMGFGRWDLGEIAAEAGDREKGLSMLEEALGEIEQSGMPDWDPDQWNEKQERVAALRGEHGE